MWQLYQKKYHHSLTIEKIIYMFITRHRHDTRDTSLFQRFLSTGTLGNALGQSARNRRNNHTSNTILGDSHDRSGILIVGPPSSNGGVRPLKHILALPPS